MQLVEVCILWMWCKTAANILLSVVNDYSGQLAPKLIN